jgi:hypothetical protein
MGLSLSFDIRSDICDILMDNRRNSNLILCHCNEFLNNNPSDTIPIAGAQLEHFVKHDPIRPREGLLSCGSDSGSIYRTFRSDPVKGERKGIGREERRIGEEGMNIREGRKD